PHDLPIEGGNQARVAAPGVCAPICMRPSEARTMDLKLIRRAAAFSVVAFLLSATAVFADTVPADGDAILPGNKAAIARGAAGPGQTITRSISFSLVCAGTSHPAENATITIQPQSFQKPLDGTISAGSTTIRPIPASWTDTPSGCPSPQP